MTRQIKFAALLTIMTLALGGLARAQWDDDDDYYQRGNGAQARQSGYQNGYRDGVKQGRHEGRENDPEDFRVPDAGQASRGYRDWMGPIWIYQNGYRDGYRAGFRSGYNKESLARGDGVSEDVKPAYSAAGYADPGSIIGPTRLVFKMARQLHAKMRQEANHTTPDHADATMMRIMATAAFTATRALIRLNTQTATVPATSLHATATKLFQAAAGTSCRLAGGCLPGEGLTVARHVSLQPSEQCRI